MMRSRAFKLLVFILFFFYNSEGRNKVFGLISVENENFSTEDVFIYDGNSKFLTSPDKNGY